MIEKDYDYGYKYFDFMRRAYKTREQSDRLGINRELMMALVQTEQGKAFRPKPITKQIEKIKGFIGKALGKMLKLKLNESEKEMIFSAQKQLNFADNSDSFVNVINLAMQATIRLKEE